MGERKATPHLAFYNRGEQIPQFLTNNINTATNSVLLPAMAAEQDRAERVRNMTMRAITLCTYVIMPVMAGLAVCAEPIVRIVLTEKWVPCVPFLQVFCVAYAFFPFHIANLNAVKAMGRSDLFLKMEILKKVIDLIILAVAMWFGPFVMALSLLAADLISQVINSWPNRIFLRETAPGSAPEHYAHACHVPDRIRGAPAPAEGLGAVADSDSFGYTDICGRVETDAQ